MIVGKPLQGVKLDPAHPDFEAAVDALHTQYIEALKQLHADNREKYGLPSEQKLIIVSSQEARNLELLRAKI